MNNKTLKYFIIGFVSAFLVVSSLNGQERKSSKPDPSVLTDDNCTYQIYSSVSNAKT